MSKKTNVVQMVGFAVMLLITVVVIVVYSKKERATETEKRHGETTITNEAAIASSYKQWVQSNIASEVTLPVSERTYGADTIMVTHASLEYIINESDVHRKKAAYGAASAYLFRETNMLSLREVYDRLCAVRVTNDASDDLRYAHRSLRYKALIPVARDTIASWTTNDMLRRADIACETIQGLHHPDSIRTIIWLDNAIADDSPLRQGESPVWQSRFALDPCYRDDCLPVYVDAVRNPQDHKWKMWRCCLNSLAYYTNDIAVSELKWGYETMKDWKKYWPSNNASGYVYAYNFRKEEQEERIRGEASMYKPHKPLLDE